MNRPLLVSVVLAFAAATAAADPEIVRLDSATALNRRLDVTIEATLASKGEVRITGDVNGTPVTIRKRMKPGHRTVTLKVDPKRLRLRAVGTAIHFNLTASASETGGATVSQSVTEDIPLPCIVLPGFGNETTPGSFAQFLTDLDAAAGGGYTTDGLHPTLVVHEYPSQTQSLATLGKSLDPLVKRLLKGTVFTKVDLVGYSYGGIVARSFLSQGGGARVRHCVFMAAPNLGLPIIRIAVGLSDSGQLTQFLGDNAQLTDLAAQLLSGDAKQALRNMYPTYQWATAVNPFTQQQAPVPNSLLELVLGSSATPLTALNAIPPASGVAFDAFYYTSTPLGQLGTVDKVDVGALQSGGQVDPAAIANGSGDGVAPAHSVTMDEVSVWKAAIAPHDMGAGTHVTMPADPAVIAGVAAILVQ